MFSRPGARIGRRAFPGIRSSHVVLPALLVGAPILPTLLFAQEPDPPVAPSAIYVTIGGAGAKPMAGFDRTGGDAGGIALAATFAIPRGESWIGRALGVRFEFSEVMYADAPYTGSDPVLAGDRISAGIRTHALGLQLTRPGQVHVRPYGSVSLGEVKMLLDADERGKLDRRGGAGIIARTGSYLALTRGPTPIVVDVSAAYHMNGTRDHWREGSTTLVRGRTDYLELSVQIGVAIHSWGKS